MVTSDHGEAGRDGACGDAAVVGTDTFLLRRPGLVQLLGLVCVRQYLEGRQGCDKVSKKLTCSADGSVLRPQSVDVADLLPDQFLNNDGAGPKIDRFLRSDTENDGRIAFQDAVYSIAIK